MLLRSPGHTYCQDDRWTRSGGSLWSASRTVMFGSLAIGCTMIGLSFNRVSAVRSGAFLKLMMALVLMGKAITRLQP